MPSERNNYTCRDSFYTLAMVKMILGEQIAFQSHKEKVHARRLSLEAAKEEFIQGRQVEEMLSNCLEFSKVFDSPSKRHFLCGAFVPYQLELLTVKRCRQNVS